MFILAAHSGLSLLLPQYAYYSSTGGLPSWGWYTVTDSTDQLYIDGMTVGRGWTQVYGQYGNALWDNKLEIRMPIAKDVIWGVGFFDAAALYAEPADFFKQLSPFSLNPFLFSFGIGVRFSIPQFPIRLYLAKGFQIQDGVFLWSPRDALDIGGFKFSFVISLGGDVF
jgi:outer membrane protein insertion porin family